MTAIVAIGVVAIWVFSNFQTGMEGATLNAIMHLIDYDSLLHIIPKKNEAKPTQFVFK